MSKFIYYRNLILSVIGIILGTSIAYVQLTQVNGGFPYKHDLVEENGYVDWVQEYDYGIRFSFADNPMNFDYPSKANGQSVVYDALANSEGHIVNILYEPKDPTSPTYTDNVYYNVFEISVGNSIIRTYLESEKAWKSDNMLMPFIVVLFLGGGLHIGRKTLKKEHVK